MKLEKRSSEKRIINEPAQVEQEQYIAFRDRDIEKRIEEIIINEQPKENFVIKAGQGHKFKRSTRKPNRS